MALKKAEKEKLEQEYNKVKSDYDNLIKACTYMEEMLTMKLRGVKKDKEYYTKKREEQLNKRK